MAAEAVERAAIWQPLAAERGITVRAVTTAPRWALAVPGAIAQILDNLVSNALDAAPAGSVIAVTHRAEPDGRISLHVIDSGPGLPADQREKALEPFWRAPGAPRGGSGLGLALVRKLAEASGGHLRLDAADPTGIDAVVTLIAAP